MHGGSHPMGRSRSGSLGSCGYVPGKRRAQSPRLGAAALLALTLTARSARPYCQENTCQADSTCETDEDCEHTGGVPVAWRRACLSVSVDVDGSDQLGLSHTELEEEVERAIELWTEADCPDGGHPSIRVFLGEPAECDQVHFNGCGPNANSVVVNEGDWPHRENGAEDLGRTTPTFSLDSGTIEDADIELNAEVIERSGTPLAGVLAHEFGHFFGLDHSPERDAVMFETYQAEANPELRDDDIAGICALYPPDAAVGECDPTPQNGFGPTCTLECTVEDDPNSGALGCSLQLGTANSSGWLLAIVGLAVLGHRRWSRRATGDRRP